MKKVRLRGPVQIHVLYPEPDFGIESIGIKTIFGLIRQFIMCYTQFVK